jgi:hypothetical protein
MVRRTATREELLSTGALLVAPSHPLSSSGTSQKHLQKGIMVKTCKVKVGKYTYDEVYEDADHESLICELSLHAKKGRTAKGRSKFMCIYCTKMFASKGWLNDHRLKGCVRAVHIDGSPLKLQPYPSMTSGGAVEVRDILEKHDRQERNAWKCIHCKTKFASKHHHKVCDRALDINGKPLKLKLYPSVPSGGAAEVRDILEKDNLHRACEVQESNQPASFGEDFLHGSPSQLPCKDGSELPSAGKHNFHEDVLLHCSPLQLLWEYRRMLPDYLCVTPIVYKEHPESHEVSFLVMNGLSFSPVYVYQEEVDREFLIIDQGKGLFDFLRQKANKALCLASVAEHEACITEIGPMVSSYLTQQASCTTWLDNQKICTEIVDMIYPGQLAADTRMVEIEDVPSTIWATTAFDSIEFPMLIQKEMNIIIMGRHEDCTRFREAEGERWISWQGAGILEGQLKAYSKSLWQGADMPQTYVQGVQHLLWNCNNLILSRRGLMPKSVVPSCCPSVSKACS